MFISKNRWTSGLVLVALVFVWMPHILHAEEEALEGVVVNIDSGEVVVDLGREHGLPSQAEIQLYRRLEVVHPVTGEVLVDRFPIGGVALDQVGQVLSIAHANGGLSRLPAVGDFAVFEPVGVRADTQDATPVEWGPERVAIEEGFRGTLGRSLTDRIATWETYIRDFPDSPYINEVGAELVWLRQLLAEQRAAVVSAEPPPPPRLRGHLSCPALSTAGRDIDTSVSIANAEDVEAVRLLARRAGEINFVTIPMEPGGDTNWRAHFSQDWTQPGTIELYAEAVQTDGELTLIAGSASRPVAIVLEEATQDAPETRDRSSATVAVDYVDFNSGPADDHYLRVEADVRYLLTIPLLHSFRIGAGVFQGEGASVQTLANDGPTRIRNVNYGFAELEMGLADAFGLAFRLSVGNSQSGADERFSSTLGTGVRMRIGHSGRTRLEIGGSLLEEVGNEAWTEVFLEAIERVPMSASVVVTNLPVGEDVGVSLNYSVGWRATDWLTLAIRTGANARTIDHFGFTGGLSTAIEW